jgi:molybdopterin synthase sulfur carrier subunit
VPLTFHIPGSLREFTGNSDKIQIEQQPATLADALGILWELHPGLRDRIATEQGQIRQHINIFIGNEDVRFTGGLASRVAANSDVWIVPSITGGSASMPRR